MFFFWEIEEDNMIENSLRDVDFELSWVIFFRNYLF
jgi:hypothetical protein